MIRSDVNHERLRLHEMDPDGLALAEAQTGLRLRALATSVAVLQTTGSGNVRGYLADLLRQGWFEIQSPESGQPIRSGASLLLDDKTVLFSFPDEPSILVSVGDLGLGFPICAVLLTRRALILETVRTDWGLAERHLKRAVTLIATSGWVPGPATAPLTLVTGDANFAHHAWNQLSALLEIEPYAASGREINLVATHQPLGSIHEIIPELQGWPLRSKSDAELVGLNGPGALFAPAGGSLMRVDLIERIKSVAASCMSAQCRATLDALDRKTGPVLWMSVRTRNRTATNQHALLVTLGSAFLLGTTDGAVIIDGHSVPVDSASQPSYVSAEAVRVANLDRNAAEAIAADILRHAPHGHVELGVGLTISDSILLAQRTSIYVCHHGTVQHKVGWFTAAPGLVHCNRALLAAGPARWVAAQSEVATEPQYLGLDMVRDQADEGVDRGEFDHLLNLGNYEVVDIPAVVQLLVARAVEHGVALQIGTEDVMRLTHLIRGNAQPAPPPPPVAAPASVPVAAPLPVSEAVAPQATRSAVRPPARHLITNPDRLIPGGILYTDFFKFIDGHLRPRSYFEIGTHLGRSVKSFTCDAVCVDPHFMLDQDVLSGRAQTHFYQMPSDRFFADHDLRAILKGGPDICFLDGMHRSEYLLRDFLNIERLCHRRSIVFMHDCLPINARMAMRTHEAGDASEGQWQHAWTGDVWKVVPMLAKYRPDLKIFYLDCAPTGLVAISNLDPTSEILSERYSGIVDELRELDLDTHTIERLWHDLPVISSQSLIDNPEDLTLYLEIA